jgi:CheY-like chemotaxis protein
MRILAIEDEKAMRELLRRALSRAGYRMITAGNAVEALLQIRLDRPDLILLDVGLPGIDGHQLAQSVANDPEMWVTPTCRRRGGTSILDLAGACTGVRDPAVNQLSGFVP